MNIHPLLDQIDIMEDLIARAALDLITSGYINIDPDIISANLHIQEVKQHLRHLSSTIAHLEDE